MCDSGIKRKKKSFFIEQNQRRKRNIEANRAAKVMKKWLQKDHKDEKGKGIYYNLLFLLMLFSKLNSFFF